VSYVSIWKPVNDRITQASRDTRTEIIGLLLGRLEKDTIIIEDSITGEFLGEAHRVMLPSSSLAKIADDMINRRIKGSVVGWYHSHTEGGPFLSATDIDTQRKLQQFSSLVTAMVVDAKTGSAGFFRVQSQTGEAIRLPEANISVFEDPTKPVPEERPARPALRPTPTIEIREKRTNARPSLNVLIASLILVALAISLGVLGLVVFRGMTGPQTLAISSRPALTATVGTPVLIQAMVNGTVLNVTLHYSAVGTNSFTAVPMISLPRSQYEYSIPGQEVTGNLLYYVEATDNVGNSVRTQQYTIPVAGFGFSTDQFALTVYRNSSITTTLGLVYTNGFNGSISLSTSGTPQGLG
jgi:proteasome lid subunit RPN8/RPN11